MYKCHKNLLIIFFLVSILIAYSLHLLQGSDLQLITCKQSAIAVTYDIVIALPSSILLFFAIDYILDRYHKKEEQNKLLVVVGKIRPSIKKFKDFFVDIYSGTSAEQVNNDAPVLKNIFHDKDDLYRKIVEFIPRKEKSPYVDVDRMDQRVFFASGEMHYLSWDNAWHNQYSAFYQDITFFEMYYGTFLSSELLDKTEALIKVVQDVISMKQMMDRTHLSEMTILNETSESFYQAIQLKNVMKRFEDFLSALQRDTGMDFLSVEIQQINSRNTHPLLGSLLKS